MDVSLFICTVCAAVSWCVSEKFRPLVDKNWMTECASSYAHSMGSILTCTVLGLLLSDLLADIADSGDNMWYNLGISVHSFRNFTHIFKLLFGSFDQKRVEASSHGGS